MSNSNTNLQTQTSSVLQNDTVSSCSISNIQEKTQLSRSRCMHSLKEIKSLFKFLSETLQDYGTMPIFKRTFSQDLDLLEQHLTKDILSRTDCTTTLTNLKSKVWGKKTNAFNSESKSGKEFLTATSSQAWLWHRRLSHLNFDTINLLSKNNIVNGLPKLKFVKDHLCSSCELGKAKRKSFHTKTTPSSKRLLQLLHMDLCGPMRVESINGKKYVLVIVDDYSRYTWTHFLRSKDETPGVLIDFLTLVQRGLHAQVTTVRTDKGTEFLNKSLHAYFAKEGIRHETVKCSKNLNKSALSKSTEPDGENLDKMKEKGDACIFVGLITTQSKASGYLPRDTRMIVETINDYLVELPQMASDHFSSDPAPQCSTTVLEQDSLSPDPQSQENVPQVAETVTTSNELELLYSPMFSELLMEILYPPPLNIHSTHQTPTQVLTVTAPENINQAETNTENAQFDDDEFIKHFSHSGNNKRGRENAIIAYPKISSIVAKGYAQKEGIEFEESVATCCSVEACTIRSLSCTSMSSAEVSMCLFLRGALIVAMFENQLTDYGIHFVKITYGIVTQKAAIASRAIQSAFPLPSTSMSDYHFIKGIRFKKNGDPTLWIETCQGDSLNLTDHRDVRTLAIEEAYTTKYSIHPGADTMLCGFRLTNRWLSMKKDIASCGSKYLAYLEVEIEYQGSSGLLLQPELPE
ncbi:retrovirus-related pol polyprotein from transposon TNT 1-94 [Tanacetum coccineum]